VLGFVGDFVENGGSNLLLSSGRQDLCDFLVHPHIPFVFLFFCDFRGIFMRFSIHMFLLHCFFEIFHGSVSPSRSDFMA